MQMATTVKYWKTESYFLFNLLLYNSTDILVTYASLMVVCNEVFYKTFVLCLWQSLNYRCLLECFIGVPGNQTHDLKSSSLSCAIGKPILSSIRFDGTISVVYFLGRGTQPVCECSFQNYLFFCVIVLSEQGNVHLIPLNCKNRF